MSDGGADRSRAEQLIAIADRLSQQKVPRQNPRRWLPIVVGAVGVVVLVAGVIGLLSSGDDSPTAAMQTTAGVVSTATVAPVTATPTTDAPSTEAPTTATPTTVTPTTATATSTTVAPTTTVVELIDPATPVRWAEFTGGKVYLQGMVPDQATADELRDKAAGVVGPDNVIVAYVIDPSAPLPSSAPLYVHDSLLFARNSAWIDPEAQGVLDLGVALMTQNPKVTIDINGYTDSDGPEESNLSLSQARVDEIFFYLVSRGIDPTKLTRTAHGEADPIADNATAAGRAKNRRVEFTVHTLLG